MEALVTEAASSAAAPAESAPETTAAREYAQITENLGEEQLIEEIMDYHVGNYREGECHGEGHIVLGTGEVKDEDVENGFEVYALVSYGEFGFENGNLVEIAGSGAIPTVMVYEVDDGECYLYDYQEAEDGSGYEESIKRMFPAELQDRVLSIQEADQKSLQDQKYVYAKAYLASIGREAAIGQYADFEYPLMTESGISEEVANKLLDDKNAVDYPYWIGSFEQVEDGVRYVYTTDLDRKDMKVIYSKTEYEGGKEIERYVFDAKTGERDQ